MTLLRTVEAICAITLGLAGSVFARHRDAFLTYPFLQVAAVEVRSGWYYTPDANNPAPCTPHAGEGIDYDQMAYNAHKPDGFRTSFQIVAAAPGVVDVNGDNPGGYGYYVMLKHIVNGRVYYTLYAHLPERPELEVGATVSRGEFISMAGSTGRSSGTHLHFELRGTRVNADGRVVSSFRPDPYDKTLRADGLECGSGQPTFGLAYPDPRGNQPKQMGENHFWISDPPPYYDNQGRVFVVDEALAFPKLTVASSPFEESIVVASGSVEETRISVNEASQRYSVPQIVSVSYEGAVVVDQTSGEEVFLPIENVAIGGYSSGQVDQRFVAMADEIRTAYGLSPQDIVPYDNNGGGEYVHGWVKEGEHLVVQDIYIRSAGLTHDRAILALSRDGSRAHVVKEGFYWLFMLHDTGMPLGNEEQGDGGRVFQRFERAVAWWDEEERLLTLKSHGLATIAEYSHGEIAIATGDLGTGGEDTYVIDEPAPGPDDEAIIPLSDVRLRIFPDNYGSGTRWFRIPLGQETIRVGFRLDYTGGNDPVAITFLNNGEVDPEGTTGSITLWLSPGAYTITARIQAGVGSTHQMEEHSIPVVVEATPRSELVPFDHSVSGILSHGSEVILYGSYTDGSLTELNTVALLGFTYRAPRGNLEAGAMHRHGFGINHLAQLGGGYLGAATSQGFAVSSGDTFRIVYGDNSPAQSFAAAPDMWNESVYKLYVGTDVNTYTATWRASEPYNLGDVLGSAGIGPDGISHIRPNNTIGSLVFGGKGGELRSRREIQDYSFRVFEGATGPVRAIEFEVGALVQDLWRGMLVSFDDGTVAHNDSWGNGTWLDASDGLPTEEKVVDFFRRSGDSHAVYAVTDSGGVYRLSYSEMAIDLPWERQEALEPDMDTGAGQEATCVLAGEGWIIFGTTAGARVVLLVKVQRTGLRPGGDSLWVAYETAVPGTLSVSTTHQSGVMAVVGEGPGMTVIPRPQGMGRVPVRVGLVDAFGSVMGVDAVTEALRPRRPTLQLSAGSSADPTGGIQVVAGLRERVAYAVESVDAPVDLVQIRVDAPGYTTVDSSAFRASGVLEFNLAPDSNDVHAIEE